MVKPKVSIIIPTYNRCDLLLKALASAMQQTYGNLEIIITDDGSTDQTEEAVKAYTNSEKVKYYRNERNLGGYPNVNRALMEYASGDYFLVLCDDDQLVCPSFIEKAVELFLCDSEIALVYGNWRVFEVAPNRYTSSTDWSLPAEVIDGKWIWYQWPGYWIFWGACVFSRKLAIRLGGFWSNFDNMDSILILSMLLNGKVGFIRETVIDYYIHERSWNSEWANDLNKHYSNMDYVRVVGAIARRQGIDREQVKAWESHVRTCLINIMLQHVCLPKTTDGDLASISTLCQLAQDSGDTKELFEAMGKSLVRFYQITKLS